MVRLLVLFLFFQIITINSVLSQSIKKAYRHYDKNEFEKLEETLIKLDERSSENSGKYYLYSLFYLKNKEDREKLKLAYQNVLNSQRNYLNQDAKGLEELSELNITLKSIDSVKNIIDSLEYEFVKDINSIEEYKSYINYYMTSKFINNAVQRWHSLEYEIISNQNSWEGYKIFMDEFPSSKYYYMAKELYEKLIFEEKTKNNSINSFEDFISKYPETPYRDSIEFTLLKKYTVNNSVDGYLKFLYKFPQSEYSKLSINFLYHTSLKEFSAINEMTDDKNLLDSIAKISNIDKLPLIGVIDDSVTYFIDKKGYKILSNGSFEFENKYLCSFFKDDFFIVMGQESNIILNRNFSEIYRSNFSHVEDIGVGLIKVFSEDDFIVLHKSGKIILRGDYDDAFVVDNSYLLMEKDNSFTLFTVFGERIFDNVFTDVYKEGTFIIFERDIDSRIAIVNTDKIKKLFLSSENPDFKYDDYEYINGDFMILIQDDNESLVDKNFVEIITMGNNKIFEYDYGWINSTEYGIKIITDLFSSDFSTYYESVINNSKYILTKRNGSWDVFFRDSLSFDIINLDSVSILSENIIWVRDKFNESLLFSNYSKMNLPDNYNLEILKSKFGYKTFIKIIEDDYSYIINEEGLTLPPAEYYYTVEKGNTISFLSKKFNISQTDLLRLNNKKSKNIFVGERIKIKGYTPDIAISDSLFIIQYNGKKGISNLMGKIVLEPKYDGITNLDSNNLILIQGESFGNYCISESSVIEPIFSSIIKPFGKNHYVAKNSEGKSLLTSNGDELISKFQSIDYLNDSLVILLREGVRSIYSLISENSILEFDSFEIIDDSLGIILVKSADDYGLFSTYKGFILNLAYDQITDIIDSDGNRLFKAIQIIPDAELLVNIIVNSDGKIILNQGIKLGLLDRLHCDIL
tara:strand:+ start:9846 stop:12596 length:2751 start_codon:yes stop_codon:yes gene_type:complete